MIRKTAVLALLLALALSSAAIAQSDRDDDANDNNFKLGIELSPLLLDNLIEKAVNGLSHQYGFDEYQKEEMREVLRNRVPAFLSEHQDNLQGLLNEWLETASAPEPPTADYAADWAKRALPMVDEFRGLLDTVSGDMREFITDDQEVILEGYLAAADIATQQVDARLHEFAAGKFNPERHWPGSPKFNRLEPAQQEALVKDMESARFDAMDYYEQTYARSAPLQQNPSEPARIEPASDNPPSNPPDNPPNVRSAPQKTQKTQSPPAAPKEDKDEWTLYVERFIERYQLNSEQQQKAHLFLDQQKTRKESYLASKGREVERITKMFQDAGKDAKRMELAENAYRKLHEPVGLMFEKLKQKLETLPTRSQRRSAAQADRATKKAEDGKTEPPKPGRRTQ